VTKDTGPFGSEEISSSALSLNEIVGQAEAVQRLKALVELARTQGRPLPHILLVGRAGAGKRTIAMALAKEMGAKWFPCAPQSLQRGGDVLGVLIKLADGDFILLEDVASVSRAVEESLCRAMEDFTVNFIMDKGLNARKMEIPLHTFTCIGTSNKASEVREELRSRFNVVIELKSYSEADLELMARALAKKRGLELAPEAATLIAQASNRELHQVRAILDLAGRPATGLLGAEDVSKALAILGRTPRAVGRGPVNTDDLAQLSGPQFEVWIGSLLERFGFRTEVTQASGDGGIDIVATLDRPLIGGRYLVQCKRYTPDALVGVPAVREFYGTLVADRGAVKGLFITTSGFTVQAREFAKTLPMELIDGPTLRALLEAVGGPPEEPPVSTFTPSPGT